MNKYAIRHPGTGKWIYEYSFKKIMYKWFEGFNIPFKIKNGKFEDFENANARVEKYLFKTNN